MNYSFLLIKHSIRMLFILLLLSIKVPAQDTLHFRSAKDTIPRSVEVAASFPGGPASWVKFWNRNLKYPKSLINEKEEATLKGEVRLRFAINPEGLIEEIEVIKSLHPALDQEALRVIKLSPTWIPATRNGKRVKQYMMQTIWFGL